MSPFRALTKVLLLTLATGTLAGQVAKAGKARGIGGSRSSLFSGFAARVLSANRVRCGFDFIGETCTNVVENGLAEDGIWPSTTTDTYIFNSGIQVAGLIPPSAGFAWAGDTVGAFFMDFRGDQRVGATLTSVLSSRDTSDLRTWPPAALVRDSAIFATTILGRPNASTQDLWVRYWDGRPVLVGGRNHPMGVVVDQRAMAFTGPGYNQDIIYLVYTVTNVTASDPATYATIDPGIRSDYIALGQQFRQLNDSAYGITIPTTGYRIDSVFVNDATDVDVGTDNVNNNYSTISIPFATAIGYEAPFREPTWRYPVDAFGAQGLAPAPGLVGVSFLRYPVDSAGHPVGIRVWTNLGGGFGYRDPVGVDQLYRYVSGTSSTAAGDGGCSQQGFQLLLKYCLAVNVEADTRFNFSSGPFTLRPGQQQTVVLAYLFAAPRDTVLPYVGGNLAPGFPALGDSIALDSMRVRLIERVAGWVTQADANADGVIEANEVKTWPGSLLNKVQLAQALVDAKFLTPQPPLPPSFFLIPGDRGITVVWQKSQSEASANPFFAVASDPTSALYDPNFRAFDVEGYRIYRGLSPNALQVVAQFDYAGTEMDDYLGDFDYQGQCAPEFGVVSGCPVPFTGSPAPDVHESNPLVGSVIQIPLGGRSVAPNGAIAVNQADTAVTGGASGFPPLVDNGVMFSWVDSSTVGNPSVLNAFHYYYAVTAFTVNSVRSGPSSLESPRIVKSVVPGAGTAFPNGTIGTPQLLDGSGALLTGTAPTLDPATGEFSGPAAPTNGLAVSVLTFLPQLLDTGSLTVRVDSVLPGFNAIDVGAQVPATYYLTTANSRGQVDHIVVPLPVDQTNITASAGAQFTGPPTSPAKGVIYGTDTAFALVAQATVTSPGAWDLTSAGRASLNGAPANSDLTGDRWWAGAANENTVGPTDSLCRPAGLSCVRTAGQLARTGGAVSGVVFIAPIQAYSTVPSVPQRDFETMTATVYRAADFSVYWGTAGAIDSVVDVTHGVPVPFDQRVGPSWGILDSTSFAGLTAANTPDGNTSVLTWSDIFCVDPVPAMMGSLLSTGCLTKSAPLGRTAHLSTLGTATAAFGVVPASQGPGFIIYLAGRFWLVATASLPTPGSVWHARYLAGHITGTRPNLSFVPNASTSAAVPGLRFRVSYAGSSLDLTHTTDSMLARVHTVPDPFYVTNALASSADSQHIEFVHLPPEAIVRIYSVSGRLVAYLTHQDRAGGGQLDWNVRSRDGKTVASGVYFYVVDTADHRSKVGRFTVVTYSP